MKYILGGGIVGLITAFYNDQHVIIADKIGGQMASGNMGPRILEVNDNSARLLEDLNFDMVPIKTAKIGYKVGIEILDSIPEELRKAYYIKSRMLTKANSVPSSIMSDGKNEIKYFDIDWNVLISLMLEKIGDRFIEAKVIGINTKSKTLKILDKKGVRRIGYDHLISTIPAPIFFNLSGLKPEEELKYASKVFITIRETMIDIRDYDYIYYPESKYKFHRITNLKNGSVSVEYTTIHKGSSIFNSWDHMAKSYHELKIGQIQSGKVQNIKGVSFIGRYACWNHDLKTDDVVEQANEIKTKLLLQEDL